MVQQLPHEDRHEVKLEMTMDRVHLLDNVCWWTGVSEVAQPTYLHNATTPAAVASYRLS